MVEGLDGLKRTHSCGELNRDNIGSEVALMGWVHRRRDHGGLIFIDLRDREGITQLVFDPNISKDEFNKAKDLRSEYVIAVVGEIMERPPGTVNETLKTGEIEVYIKLLKVLNTSKPLPFSIPVEDEEELSESIRLRYRYLDLRRAPLQQNIRLRYKTVKTIRDFFDQNGFIEIETPFLTKSTPEGARDYLVPSRVNLGKFYALPQSPQIFKQLLMVSGYDRYFQIVKCFRDEDLRADRQPEFTQIDVEMSFITPEDIFEIIEKMMFQIFKKVKEKEIKLPFPRITYQEAIEKYGTDKPDTRYGLELVDVTDIFTDSDFKVFQDVIKKGGKIGGINVKGCSSFSRKDLDELTEFTQTLGSKGLAWLKIEKGEINSPIAKFFKEEELKSLSSIMKAEEGDILFMIADRASVVTDVLCNLRIHLADKLKLKDSRQYNFLWVTDFPLLEYDEEEKRFVAMHHPFTSPVDEDITLFEKDPAKIRAKAYDLVLNGEEIGGGSIRIHQKEIQDMMFNCLGIGKDEAREKFGFLLEAFEYGAPPHGGIALGLDRILMILSESKSIRDVIPFPKTQKATCLLTNAPSSVDKRQLNELHLKLLHQK